MTSPTRGDHGSPDDGRVTPPAVRESAPAGSHRRRLQWRLSVMTAVVWVLLWGDLSLANLVSGFMLGLLIA